MNGVAASTYGLGTAANSQMSPSVAQIEEALAQAEDLKRWWADVEAGKAAVQSFELFPAYPGMEPVIGFFGQAPVQGQIVPVMGDVGDYFFDQPRVPDSERTQAARWMAEQVEEFALRYWMRVQAWTIPQPYPELDQMQPSRFLREFSWCFPQNPELAGMANRQRYFKLRASSTVGAFPPAESSAIIDLRDLGTTYDWITVDRRLFDFNITLSTDNDRLSLVVPIGTVMHLVLNKNLTVNQSRPRAGILGEYGAGFGLIKDPNEGVIAFGPDKVQPGLELQFLRVLDSGVVRLRIISILAQPEKLVNLSINPVEWGLQAADLATLGTAKRFTEPAEKAMQQLPFSRLGFDPLLTTSSLLNTFISQRDDGPFLTFKEHFQKEMLVKDAVGLGQGLLGTRLTWLQVPDWVNGPIPPWIREGKILSPGGTE